MPIILQGERLEKRNLRTEKYGWKHRIKINLTEIGFYVNWAEITPDPVQWLVLRQW